MFDNAIRINAVLSDDESTETDNSVDQSTNVPTESNTIFVCYNTF